MRHPAKTPVGAAKSRLLFGVLLAGGLGFVDPSWAQPPPNDACAGAAPISAIPQTVTTPVTEATAEPTDVPPPCYPIADNASVWYRFTPAGDQQVRFDTTESSTNTVITVFTGGCGQLQPIDCDYQYGINGTYNHGMVDFFATAGQTYLLMVSNVFQPGAGAEVVVEASAGQSHPVTVHATDASSGADLPAARVWIRDDTGGFYTIREGVTGADGQVTLYPPNPWTLEAQASAQGHVVTKAGFDLAGGPAQVPLALPPMGPVPQPAQEPSRLVFLAECGLHTMLADGSDERCIPVSYPEDPVWSPDGAKIAFSAPLNFNFGQPYQIYVVGADGSDLTQLTHFPYPGGAADLAWSPDGSKIIFDRCTDAPFCSSLSIYTVDAASGENLQMVREFGYEPVYSPDGSMIAFSDGPELRVMRSDGSHVVTVHPWLAGNPDWSPDGTLLASGGEQITVVGLDGSNPRAVTSGAPFGTAHWNPTWSPDGRQIVYQEYYFEDWYLNRVDLSGGPSQVIRLGPVDYAAADWSFAPTYDVPGDLAPQVQVVSPNGGELWTPGSTVTIEWEASDDIGIASQDLYLITYSGEIPIALGLPGSARSLQYTVPNLWSYVGAWVRIWVYDGAGQNANDFSRYPFSISDGSGLYIQLGLDYPTGGESFSAGEQVLIQWQADSNITLGDFEIELSLDGGFSYRQYIDPFVSNGERSLSWTVPADVSDRAVIRIRTCNGGSCAWDESGAFSLNSGPAFVPKLAFGPGPGGLSALRTMSN